MIDAHFQKLGIGNTLIEYAQLEGGSMHLLWYVKTDQGQYAVKRIDRTNLELLGDRLLPIEQSQRFAKTAHFFRHISGVDWLVHEWLEGEVYLPEQCSPEQLRAVGSLLSQINHPVHLSARPPTWHQFDLPLWQRMVDEGLALNRPWALMYQQALEQLAPLGKILNQSASYFTERLVMSHRDISHSNIIWDQNLQPTLIDWEFVGLIHPDIEYFITLQNFQALSDDRRAALDEGYAQSCTLSDEQCQIGYLGYCLDWLLFNMQRSLSYPQFQVIADEQLLGYLSVVMRQCQSLGARYS